KQGQVIANIDSKIKEINLKSTELSIQQSKDDYHRNKELREGNAINEKAVSDATYNEDSNKIQAEQLRQQVEDANIVSPISGVITSKKMVSGEFANIGSTLAEVIDINNLKCVVYVNENDVYNLKLGQVANIKTDIYPSTTFSGKIIYISPIGDENHN